MKNGEWASWHILKDCLIENAWSCVMDDHVAVQSLSRVWLCDPRDCSTPGFTILYYLLEFVQTHVHWVGNAIQASHPLWLPSPAALNHSQHQSVFQWVGSLHHVLSRSFSFSISPSQRKLIFSDINIVFKKMLWTLHLVLDSLKWYFLENFPFFPVI